MGRVDALYDEARAAGEMQQPVDVTALTKWVAENKGKDKLAPIISTIENELKQNAKTVGGGADPLTLAQRPKQTVMTLDASEDLRQAINKHLLYTVGKDSVAASKRDWLYALSAAVRDRLVERWMETTRRAYQQNVKRVYYREAYRDPAGLDTLRQGGVEVIHYNRWRDLWR